MSRDAIRRGFEGYVADVLSETAGEFDVAAALGGSGGASGKVVDKLLGHSDTVQREVVRPELLSYRDAITRQFETVLEFAASDAAFETVADEVLARDLYWDALRRDVAPQRRDRIRERLLARQRRLGEALAPMLETDADTFWGAAAAVYDREAALDLAATHFSLTDPLREDRDAYELTVRIDPGDLLGGFARALPAVTVEYTDEALRALEQAESAVLRQAKRDARAAFED